MSSAAARRLAKAVKQRRDELDKTQLEIWADGGPSNTTLTKIENGEMTSLERATRRKLDTGLQWKPGSALAVWEGTAEPVPVTPRTAEDLLAALDASDLDEATKAHIRAVVERDRGTSRGESRGSA